LGDVVADFAHATGLNKLADLYTRTQVGNRLYLEGRLRALIAEFDQDSRFGVLFIDITPDSLVHRADRVMYQSIQAGRNRGSVG
jgi:GGDEF domain-containing protein